MFYIEGDEEDEEEYVYRMAEKDQVQDDIYIISEESSLWQALYRLMWWVERQEGDNARARQLHVDERLKYHLFK